MSEKIDKIEYTESIKFINKDDYKLFLKYMYKDGCQIMTFYKMLMFSNEIK